MRPRDNCQRMPYELGCAWRQYSLVNHFSPVASVGARQSTGPMSVPERRKTIDAFLEEKKKKKGGVFLIAP